MIWYSLAIIRILFLPHCQVLTSNCNVTLNSPVSDVEVPDFITTIGHNKYLLIILSDT